MNNVLSIKLTGKDEISRIRDESREDEKVSSVIKRELARYRELLEATLPTWLTPQQLLDLAQYCAATKARQTSAALWWRVIEDIFEDLKIAIPDDAQLNLTSEIAILSFVDRLGENPTLQDVEYLLTAWNRRSS